MRREAIASGHLKAIGYDPQSLTLEVEFRTGGVYQYAGVPAHVVDELRKADSVGAFFNREIRNRYAYRKVRAHR